MKKKIFSLFLAVVIVVSMVTVAMVSVSASIDENGRYVPSTEDTYRYYFYMPNSWKNSYTQDTYAGVYWWAGTDKCDEFGTDDDGAAWPGYVAQYEGDYEHGAVYYIDCPDDVSTIIWNNYVNGGTFDKETGEYEFSKEQYISAIQTVDISQLDDPDISCNWDLYPDGLENFNNMIYVLDYSKTQENALNGKLTFAGDWYYYYGDGKYGIQPTLEEAEAAGWVMDSEYQPAIDHDPDPPYNPTQPTTSGGQETTYPSTSGKTINFDVKSAKWGDGVKAVYCHIYNYSGTDGKKYTSWQLKEEKCEYNKKTGIATYDLQTGIDKGADGLSTIDSSNKWVVMFSCNTGAETYILLFNSNCFGDTVVADPYTKFENNVDSEKSAIKISYHKNKNITAPKSITSTGKVQGETFAYGETNATILGDYMATYAADDKKVNKDIISKLSNELGIKPSSVLNYVKNKIYEDDISYPYPHHKENAIKHIEKVIIEVEGGELTVDIPAITNLQNTADGIRISWNKVAGAYGYRLYYKYPGKDWKRFKDTTATSFTDTGVSAGRTETYTIRCIDKDGNTISGYNSGGWSYKYEPVNPTITKLENTSTGIKISWDEIAGVYGYRLYYKYPGKDWKRFKDTTSTSFTDTGVSLGRTETYTIRCIDKDGNTISGYNPSGWSKTYSLPSSIPQITNLENTSSGIKISWNKVAGAYGYRLYYKYPGKDWKRFKDTTATSFTDTGVSAGRTETYTIRCIDKNGNTISGYYSNGWSKKYEPVTPTITKLEKTSNGVKISWNPVAGVYGYRLYYKYPGQDWKRFKDTTGTSFTDTGVKAGRTETYTIRCIDKNGNTISGYNPSGWSITYR